MYASNAKPKLQADDDEDDKPPKIKCKDDPNCDPYEQGMDNFYAFNQGFEGDLYARNFSNCIYDMFTWMYKDIPTYKVKLHYGNYDNHVTNTDL